MYYDTEQIKIVENWVTETQMRYQMCNSIKKHQQINYKERSCYHFISIIVMLINCKCWCWCWMFLYSIHVIFAAELQRQNAICQNWRKKQIFFTGNKYFIFFNLISATTKNIFSALTWAKNNHIKQNMQFVGFFNHHQCVLWFSVLSALKLFLQNKLWCAA